MPNYVTKADTSKATPVRRGELKLRHNLFNAVGETLYRSLQEDKNIGTISGQEFLRNLNLDLDLDLGKGYSANLGYNKYLGELRQDLKLTLSKKF